MRAAIAAVALALGIGISTAQGQSSWTALPQQAHAPANNPTTPAKVELGRLLFNDNRLSESRTVSCASCHNVAQGGADSRTLSVGVHGQTDTRNTPTVLNVGFLAAFFWDARAESLEEQAKMQLLDPVDMGMKSLPYALERIRQIPGYGPYFQRAFGSGDVETIDNLVRAIAAYERSLVTANAPYDRFVAGDSSAMSEQQVRGMNEFKSLDCSRCHQGPAFDGPSLVPGTPWVMTFPTYRRSPYVAAYDLGKDQGRYQWTGKDSDRYQWRVPSLRNLKYTAPYMHNGAVDTLPNAVRIMGSTELNQTLTDAEVADIVSFLEALSGPLPVEPIVSLPDASTPATAP
jgi:cytochrome c peroxidase